MFYDMIFDNIDNEGISACIYAFVNSFIIALVKTIGICIAVIWEEAIFFFFLILIVVLSFISVKRFFWGKDGISEELIKYGGFMGVFAILYLVLSIVITLLVCAQAIYTWL
ncbi:MAG: hypothetical protein K6F99_04975 [Lachnospiraceae bacterium]|nr:hypothetical protein [Lachnospiraceae bacterium]